MSGTTTTTAPLPALLFCEATTGHLRVAALTLLDRLIVAAHRAGCAPIRVVCAGETPRLARTPALGICVEFVAEAPMLAGPTLVATTSQLVQASDLREVIQQGGRLVTEAGRSLPIGVVSQLGTGALEESLSGLASVVARGVAVPVTDEASARDAEAAWWKSLTSSSDGFVDRWFNRPVGRPFSKLIIHTPITPNQVSVASIVIGTAGGILFGWGEHALSVIAAVLFQISAIVDCMDGDVARSVFKESSLGKWLDLVGDQVVHAAVFAGIAIGLWRSGHEGPMLWLGASAVLGGLISFAVVLRGMAQKGEPSRRLQKLIDGATSRDFSVLVLALACVGRLHWFMWLAAIGSHVFWVTALALQLAPARSARAAS
jgi:phosphatidylglycerophosphate synthase